MLARPVPLRAPSRPSTLLVLALTLLTTAGWAGFLAPAAKAEACPGAGTRPCPYSSAGIIGRRAEGVLRFPEAVAIGPAGDVYVADQLGYTVQKLSPAGAFEAEWGSYGGGHGQFGPIGGLATDGAGNVYVVDSSHNRIEKFDPNGSFILAWGRGGSEPGQFHFGSSQDYTKPPGGGIAVAGEFVYVADSGNDRVQRFNLQGGEAMSWGGKGSAPGQFSYPRGVAANAAEVLVSDDDNHRIEKFAPEGAFIATVGSQGTGAGQFGFPYGVALDAAGNAYVADDINHRVVKLDPQLGFAGAWGGFGTRPGQLAFPRALAADPAGNTYVADTANDRISVFDPEGNFLRALGISARGPGQLTGPRGLAIDPTGRLLASDTVGNRLELFAPGSGAFAGQWTLAAGRGLSRPAGLAVDPLGSVYIADAGNARVSRFWGDGTYLSEIGGPANLGGAQLSGASGVAVSPTATYVADGAHNRVLVYGPEGALKAKWGAEGGNGQPGTGPAQFDHPQALAVGPGGDVYVADTGNDRVQRLSPDGALQGAWGGRGSGDGRFRSPNGIAVDAAGDVYVLDSENNRVEAFDSGGRFLDRWGNRGVGLGQLSQPAGLAVGCEGSVYVADTNNNRIQRFDPVNRQATGCVAASSWPPPLDVAPVLQVRLLRARGVLARRGLSMTVACQRGCRVLVKATLAPSGARRGGVPLRGIARALPVARVGHLRLPVGPVALRRLRHGLGRRHGMRASVTVVAEGPTGRRTTVRRTYLVSR
jgi:tripartite motif-containing protein 71